MIKLPDFFPQRLWQQIFLILLGVMIIPLMILGVLLIETSRTAMEQIVTRDLKQVAFHAKGEVLREYEGAFRAIEATAAILGTLHADSWRQETAIVELSLKYPTLRRICSVDLQGQPIACSGLGEDLSAQIQPDLISCANNPQNCITKVHIAPDHVPVMGIASPIKRYGKIQGVLMAEYNLRGVWDVVDNINLGPQSRAILVDQYGRILAHPDKKEVMKNNMFGFQEVVGDTARMIVDKDGKRWVMAYSPMESLQWGLIVAQPYQEAFSFVDRIKQHSWLLVIFGVFAAALLGFIIARWMSRPIQEIIRATRRLASGDLNVALPVQREDEIGSLKNAFNHMTAELRKARHMERLSMVGKSAASIAHELKNSLVLVKSFVQIIPERHKDKAFVHEATETIVRELNGWNSMLRNIMDFAREQMPLKSVPANINTIVEESTLLIKFRPENRGVQFHVKMADKMPLINGDEGKIKQVVINLIANAFEAVPSGGEIIVTTFSTGHTQHSFAGFEVHNSGEGIPAENLSRIFMPFFTTKDSGLGIGLAICQDIVKKHGGRLEVSSKKGEGATFRAVFPVYIPDGTKRNSDDFREDSDRG